MAKRAREAAPFQATEDEPASSSRPRPRKTVIFIRHGQSEFNLAMKETGEDPLIRDALLTAKGRRQAQAAREELAGIRSQIQAGAPAGGSRWLLAASPLRRALDTASEVWPEAVRADVGGRGGIADAVRFEVSADLREVLCACDDIGSTPATLSRSFPHLERHLTTLPEVWWTVPAHLAHLPADGPAMRDAYKKDPDAWEDADEDALDGRLTRLVDWLASVPEDRVVIVAHNVLIRCLTKKLGLREDDGDGWCLANCEVRVAEDLEISAVGELEDSSRCLGCFGLFQY